MKAAGRILSLLLILLPTACMEKAEPYRWESIIVTATAYNSVPSQTANHPSLAAWGDTLRPGMKCIAVSRDLMALGLKHNTPVQIEGLRGIYLVKDKMHYRWKNKIDIYMGLDIRKARQWGRKKLTIRYAIPNPPQDSILAK